MKKCEPWAVAAVYLMQSASGKEHYTDIVNYIVITGLTEVAEKSAATARAVIDRISQKVINGRAVFKSDGNGYYSLGDEATLQKNEDIQGVIQCLNEKNLKINLVTHEDKEAKPVKQEQILEDEILDDGDDTLTDGVRKLSDEGKRLSEEARKLSDETMRLSEETMRFSDETVKLNEENKELRKKNRRLEQENQHLGDENEKLHEMAKKLRQEKQQIEEKLQSIKQLC